MEVQPITSSEIIVIQSPPKDISIPDPNKPPPVDISLNNQNQSNINIVV